MTDYNKQTVAQLRQLLKDRGIPSTGLTRKAQIVEKLEEADASEGGDAPANEEAQTEKPSSGSSPDQPNDDAPADRIAQVQQDDDRDITETKEDAPGPPLSEAGGMSTWNAGITQRLTIRQNQQRNQLTAASRQLFLSPP
jgi:hypothetical protein